MRKKIYVLVLFVFFMQDLFSQCAMCKAVAEEAAEESGSTINTGIIYIMLVPYILLAVAAFVYRAKLMSFFKDLSNAGVPNNK